MSGNQAKIGSALTAMFNLLLLGLIQNNLAVSVLVRYGLEKLAILKPFFCKAKMLKKFVVVLAFLLVAVNGANPNRNMFGIDDWGDIPSTSTTTKTTG